MRIRTAAVGACACLALAACSSSGSSGPGAGSTSPSSTPMSSHMSTMTTSSGSTAANAGAFCQRLQSASHNLSGLAKDVSSPTQLGNKLGPIVTQLQQLESGAPAQVSPALQDLVSAMQNAKQAASGGNVQKIAQQMRQLVPKLTKDFQKLETYVASNCH